MSTIQEVTSESAFNTFLESTTPSTLLILYFHTPWAPPCKQMATILSTLATTYPVYDSQSSPTSPLFLSLNAEDLPDISERYEVSAVPFLVLLRDNNILETVSGSDATKVRAAVERHAGSGTKTSKQFLPPAQTATPSKDLSSYTPGSSETQTQAPPETNSSESDKPTSSATELHDRLTSLVKAAPVMLFMKGTPSAPQCGFSRQLVGLLRERGVRYGFFNILADDDVRQGLKEFADWPTFPQLWATGELVGGLDIVSPLHSTRECKTSQLTLVRTGEGRV
jgi:Grx4 family monothiol glutaredoxin